MSEERGSFLSRWSRLKRGTEPVAPAAPEPVAIRPAEPEETLPEGKSLEESLAELPRLEELVPGQSVAAFMQPWVPVALRNAALQRMWLLDPAISGYVDPALDYAYDYNAIGGAPGFGPMETSREAVQEVAEMFDRALGRTSPEKDEAEEPVSETPADAPESLPAAAHPEVATLTPPDNAATHNNISDTNDLRPVLRRHGRALPG